MALSAVGRREIADMIGNALSEGADAFARGQPRITNPHSPDDEAWMDWRDGWEQAKAFAANVFNRIAAEQAGTTG